MADNLRNLVPAFRNAGVGQAITQTCDYCSKPRHQLGGSIVKRGTLRLFKCAVCKQAAAEQKAIAS